MARGSFFSTEEIQEIVRLRGEDLSFREIARRLNRSKDGVARAWKRHVNQTGNPVPEVAIEGEAEVDVLVDATELDGTVSIVKKTKVISPDELKAMADLNNDWICTHFKDGSYQSPMKLRTKVGDTYIDKPHVQTLYKSQATFKRVIEEPMRQAIRDWISGAVKPVTVPKAARLLCDPQAGPAQVVTWGIWDAHIGMYAFHKEVGSDYDVTMAVNRCLNSIDDMIFELSRYPIKTIYSPVGNDFMHFDNVRQRTTSATNDLDSDTRFARAYRGATIVLEYFFRRAAEICDDVRGFCVPGNHDYLMAYTLIAWLEGRFRDHPNISIDLNENPQKIVRHGGCAIFFEHGQNIKPNQFPLIFHEHVLKHAEDNGIRDKITYKEVQVGHKHQKRVRVYESEVPTNGLRIITNPALCNVDFYHHSHGLIGEPMKSVEAYRYDEIGCRGSHITWARDDDRKV